jgi:hypothetical protein
MEGLDKASYNKALEAVLAVIEDETRVLQGVSPRGLEFKVLYKETLVNVIKKLKKKTQ